MDPKIKAIEEKWISVGQNNRNIRCVTERWGNNPKTYLECECKNDRGVWRKNRICLDDYVISGALGSAFQITRVGRRDTLSTNLVSPHPPVSIRGYNITIKPHVTGRRGPEWRDISLKGWVTEDGELIPRDSTPWSWSKAVRKVWDDKNNEKKRQEEDEQKRRDEQNKKQWTEESQRMRNELVQLKKERESASGMDKELLDSRINAIEDVMKTGFLGMPGSKL